MDVKRAMSWVMMVAKRRCHVVRKIATVCQHDPDAKGLLGMLHTKIYVEQVSLKLSERLLDNPFTHENWPYLKSIC